MLEAFCDLTDFPPWRRTARKTGGLCPLHGLEGAVRLGDLLTNIFAGGTVDSEWGFLTGYTQHEDLRKPTDSYVWYFREQGYHTLFHHPGYSWFYNRQNVNEYLGFEESWFTENCLRGTGWTGGCRDALRRDAGGRYSGRTAGTGPLVLLLRQLSEPRSL